MECSAYSVVVKHRVLRAFNNALLNYRIYHLVPSFFCLIKTDWHSFNKNRRQLTLVEKTISKATDIGFFTKHVCPPA